MHCALFILGVLRTLPLSTDAADAHPSLSSSSQPLPSNGLGNYAIDSLAAQVMHDIQHNPLSSRSAFTSSSPECWRASINTIHQLALAMDQNDGEDYQKRLTSSGDSFCASMTVAQQNILALELTNCQLMSANLQLYESSVVGKGTDRTDVQGCSVGMGGANPYDATSCFPLMSPYAFNLYNTIRFHTETVCMSLTEERMMMEKEEVTSRLLRASSAVSQQMQEAAFTIEQTATRTASILQKHTENIMREQREERQQMDIARREDQEYIRAVALTIEQTTENIMREQREELRQEQESIQAAALTVARTANHTASMLQEHTEQIMMEQREELRREQESIRAAALTIEQMANQTASMMQIREREATMVVERMQTETASLIAEQARLQEMIASANSQLQPLSSIEFYVRMAVGGFAAVKALLNFFLSANATWIVTSVPLFWRGRRYAYGIFTLGLLAEFAAIWFMESNPSSDSDRMDTIGTVRILTRVSAVATLILSSFVTCICPPKKDSSSLTMDDVLRSQMDFVAKLNELAPTEVRSKRIQGPRIAAKYSAPISVKLKEDSPKTMPTTRDENASFIISNRNFKPNTHRSRSPYRSSLTGMVVPVVTPTKPRAEAYDDITTALDCDRAIAYCPHQHDANAKQDENASSLELEYARTPIQNGEEEMCGSSSDESSFDGSSSFSKNIKKRTASDVYSSSGEESHFFSANDAEVSVSSTPEHAMQSKSRESKKTKLMDVSIY